MPVGSSVETRSPFVDLSGRRRVLLVLIGLLPLAHVTAVSIAVVAPVLGWVAPIYGILAPLVLYVVPPLFVRAFHRFRPYPTGRFPLDSRALLDWWLTAQWQIVFNRLPFLDELLRLMPGLYSAWLRLWGSRVGRLVYWSPGCRVADRNALDVGDRVVIGAGAHIYAHLITTRDGGGTVALGRVAIGVDALVGGHSILTSGVKVAPGEMLPGTTVLRPFDE